MFCPKCRGEFQDGIFQCPDCGVDLVLELVEDLEELVPLFEADNQLDLELVKSILGTADIPVVVQGEHLLTMGEGATATVFVPQERLSEAGAILDKGVGERDDAV